MKEKTTPPMLLILIQDFLFVMGLIVLERVRTAKQLMVCNTSYAAW